MRQFLKRVSILKCASTACLIAAITLLAACDRSEQNPTETVSASNSDEPDDASLAEDADAETMSAKSNALLLAHLSLGDFEKAEQQVAAGADVDSSEFGATLLEMLASGATEREAAVRWLLNHGADANQSSDDYTPLMGAARKGYLAVARALIDAGADVNAATESGWTALHGAVSEGQISMAELLITHGADVNARAEGGLTPLHTAITYEDRGHTAMVKLLVASGAGLRKLCDNNHTAWGLAQDRNPELAAFLKNVESQKTKKP
jgi:ankyrin repeat protein